MDCVATPRLKHEMDAKAPGVDLGQLWASQGINEGLARQTKEDVSGLEIEKASLDPDKQIPTPKLLDSPTRSCDSISEAGSSDREDDSSPQHQRAITTSSQAQHMQERSIHDISAIFAPRRRQVLSRMKQTTRRITSRKPPLAAFDHGEDRTTGDSSLEQDEGQKVEENPMDSDSPSITATSPSKSRPLRAEGPVAEADPVSETENTSALAALHEGSNTDGVGLQDGDQNSINKTPKSERHQIISTVQAEINQLVTPSTSPTSKSESQLGEDVDEMPQKPSLTTKTKRRLNLHSGSYNSQPAQKKRKTPPKKQSAVQTTLSLNIGAGAGMKECKVCDTVYNPFHPEDVKVHAKRHAVVLKSGVKV